MQRLQVLLGRDQLGQWLFIAARPCVPDTERLCSLSRSTRRHLKFESKMGRQCHAGCAPLLVRHDFNEFRPLPFAMCRDELVEGAEVQIMPCSAHHVYHPDCLAPWLAQHNSCPVCRHELPTDDQKYETAKERAAAEAEERRGAENALSHAEFIYT